MSTQYKGIGTIYFRSILGINETDVDDSNKLFT